MSVKPSQCMALSTQRTSIVCCPTLRDLTLGMVTAIGRPGASGSTWLSVTSVRSASAGEKTNVRSCLVPASAMTLTALSFVTKSASGVDAAGTYPGGTASYAVLTYQNAAGRQRPSAVIGWPQAICSVTPNTAFRSMLDALRHWLSRCPGGSYCHDPAALKRASAKSMGPKWQSQ